MTAEPLPTNVGRERGGWGGTHSSGAKERRRVGEEDTGMAAEKPDRKQ